MGARPGCKTTIQTRLTISIHSLRVGARRVIQQRIQGIGQISIHSLRVGARPPTWPATAAPMGNFNPLAPRGSETANTYKKAGILSPQQYNFHKQLSNYKAYFSFPSLFLHSATQFFGAKVPGKQCVLGVRTKSSPPQKGADCRVEARTNGGAIRRRSSGWTGAGRRRRRTP